MQRQNLTPKNIESVIRKTIIGQDEAVRAVATAIAAHVLRIDHNQNFPDEPIQKTNLLVIGPPGCGKTETIRTILREFDLDIPVAVINASTLTSSGYKGKNAEDIIIDLAKDAIRIVNKNARKYVHEAKNPEECKKLAEQAVIRLANQGIIVLDEMDKLRIKPDVRLEDNLFQRGVQQQLLKIIEGGTGLTEDERFNKIDTTNVLFILAGAHIGLEEITKQRLQYGKYEIQTKAPIGFTAKPIGNTSVSPVKQSFTDKELLPSAEDLIQYGYLPELVGRVQMRCKYKPVTENILYRILAESKLSPVTQATNMFFETENHLIFTNDALKAIATKAAKENTGVRGLKTIISDIIYNIYYEFAGNPGHTITITENTVTKGYPAMISDFLEPAVDEQELSHWEEDWEDPFFDTTTHFQ